MAKPHTKTLRERIARALFGDLIDAAVASAVTVRVDDSAGWDRTAGGASPLDRAWSEWRDDADDALEAYRKNFLVRRIVNLTRSYVVGNGITISSSIPQVETFARDFWSHHQNRMVRRLGPLCDELTRVGEVFPVLFTNRFDGMSYVRFIPASRIHDVETAEGDYELELRYRQLTGSVDGRWWIGPGHPRAFGRARGGKGGWHLEPLMLHFAVNRPVGGVRGEGGQPSVRTEIRRTILAFRSTLISLTLLIVLNESIWDYGSRPAALGARSARNVSGIRMGCSVFTSTVSQSIRARASSAPSLTRVTV